MISFQELLFISDKLLTAKNQNQMLEDLLKEAIRLTQADKGKLYMTKNDGVEIRKATKEGVQECYLQEEPSTSEYQLMKRRCREAINGNQWIVIDDVYTEDEIDLSDIKKQDEREGRHTQSMLIMPINNNQKKIFGAIELVKHRVDEKVSPFTQATIEMLTFIATQAGIILSEHSHTEDIRQLFYSFIEVLSTAIDERTPYNANHTRNLVKHIDNYIKYSNSQYVAGKSKHYISEIEAEQLLISGWLHDIGKIITPTEVMNKATRLHGRMPYILQRLDYITSLARINHLENRLSEEALEEQIQEINQVREHILKCNEQRDLEASDMAYTLEVAKKTYKDLEGQSKPWLEEEEIKHLLIEKGTLTNEERAVMEAHVGMTTKLLSKINFDQLFSDVPYLAGSHHEYLDGTGYPEGLKAEELKFGARLIAVMDIYEALSSADRPYKQALSQEQSFNILDKMVLENKIDGEIVSLLKEMQYATAAKCEN